MVGHTLHFHRVLRAAPQLVYQAFLDPAALAKWLPPNGFVGIVHALDARVGGSYRMSFRHLATGQEHAFGGTYLELTPGERIRYDDRFDDPGLPGEMHTTVTLKAVSCGCDVEIVQQGVPEAIPAEMCHLGWQDSLRLLAQLVEGTAAK